jgi:hypothetical protein
LTLYGSGSFLDRGHFWTLHRADGRGREPAPTSWPVSPRLAPPASRPPPGLPSSPPLSDPGRSSPPPLRLGSGSARDPVVSGAQGPEAARVLLRQRSGSRSRYRRGLPQWQIQHAVCTPFLRSKTESRGAVQGEEMTPASPSTPGTTTTPGGLKTGEHYSRPVALRVDGRDRR